MAIPCRWASLQQVPPPLQAHDPSQGILESRNRVDELDSFPLAGRASNRPFQGIGQESFPIAGHPPNIRAESSQNSQRPRIGELFGQDHLARVHQSLDDHVIGLAGAIPQNDVLRRD